MNQLELCGGRNVMPASLEEKKRVSRARGSSPEGHHIEHTVGDGYMAEGAEQKRKRMSGLGVVKEPVAQERTRLLHCPAAP